MEFFIDIANEISHTVANILIDQVFSHNTFFIEISKEKKTNKKNYDKLVAFNITTQKLFL